MIKSNIPEKFGMTISYLWLFAILNMVFRDIHEFTMASTVNEILAGYVNGNPMSEQVLLFGAFAVELLLLGFLFSALLSPRKARLANLVLAPLAIAGIVFGQPSDPDDYFFAAVEIITFISIFVLCLNWKPTGHDVSASVDVEINTPASEIQNG